MRIHDKFVIELSEVIKGYGNDYRVEEPFHLPCDYKFYEISGVAICEESVKKMKPLTEEINLALDKIRAEIIELRSKQNVGVLECLDIIDKYKSRK